MGNVNDKFEITSDISPATSEALVITWTANEPTAAATQTIADGDSPTVAETGQAIANLTDLLNKLVTDVADIRTKLNS